MIEQKKIIRLAIIDDHPVLLDGLSITFAAHDEFEVVGQGANYDDAMRVAEKLVPDIMLVDIGMPGGGIRAAKDITVVSPSVKVIILTASESADDVLAALKNGAAGYALKDNSGAELVDIIKTVNGGQSYVPPKLAGKMLIDMNDQVTGGANGADPLKSLTSREDQILKLVAEGLSNKEIGLKLDLQEKTVKHYMTNILQKLQVRNRVEAALVATGHTHPHHP